MTIMSGSEVTVTYSDFIALGFLVLILIMVLLYGSHIFAHWYWNFKERTYSKQCEIRIRELKQYCEYEMPVVGEICDYLIGDELLGHKSYKSIDEFRSDLFEKYLRGEK